MENAGDAVGAQALRAQLEADLQASAALIRDPTLRAAFMAQARAQSVRLR